MKRSSILIRLGLAIGSLWALGWILFGWLAIAVEPQVSSWHRAGLASLVVFGLVAAGGFIVFYGAGHLLHWVFTGKWR